MARVGRLFETLYGTAYGTVYDWIFRRFRPYQALLAEVVASARTSLDRADAPRLLELRCGTGSFSAGLAEHGYEVVGEDPYPTLIERASRKAAGHRRLSFRVGPGADGGYDLAVSVHALYAQRDPARELALMSARVKDGGHAIVVNFARPAPVVATVRAVRAREGLGAALHALLWLLPNALFDAARGRSESHYWTEAELGSALEAAGFDVIEMRPVFLAGISLLARCRKRAADSATRPSRR